MSSISHTDKKRSGPQRISQRISRQGQGQACTQGRHTRENWEKKSDNFFADATYISKHRCWSVGPSVSALFVGNDNVEISYFMLTAAAKRPTTTTIILIWTHFKLSGNIFRAQTAFERLTLAYYHGTMDNEGVLTRNLCDVTKTVDPNAVCFGDRLERGDPRCGCPDVSEI